MIEVVIGNCERGTFSGFKARFDGKEVASYQTEDGLVFTLYECGWGDYEGYRVYKADERTPFTPEYEILPCEYDDPEAPKTEYHSLFEAKEIMSYYPMFAKHIELSHTRDIDPQLRRK
jgi:hypothetical protein